MKKMKVMTVVGTRPEIIRLSRLIPLLDRETDHVLVHTGQNYDDELSQVFFRDLELRDPDHFLGAAGDTPMQTIGNTLIRVDPVLASEKPDALLVLGDTNSCLAVIAAKRRRIPVFHMEAGNRCFDDRVPEEINRRIVDHLSDINLPYSERARELLLREGILPDRVIKTGSPMMEVLRHNLPKAKASTILKSLSLSPGEYFVLSAHREENVDNPLRLGKLIEIANLLAASFDLRVIVSTHPRTRSQLEGRHEKLDRRVELHKPFGYLDYLQLQLNARLVISDSGTITEESAILNVPALNIRETHERHEGMEEAAVMMVGLDPDRVMQGVAVANRQSGGPERNIRIPPDYDVPNVSEKVLRIILSYTDYVNRVVWQKSMLS